MMNYLNVREEKNILYINLNRPEKHNAFHPEMISELTESFKKASSETHLRALVLSGEGKSFCAGADLGWMKSMISFSLEENKKDSMNLYSMFESIQECALPVIACIHGRVMGGAIGLVACSDIVLAERNTKFCFSEVKLGLIPAVISPFVQGKMLPALYREWMITGEVFDAEQAKLGGLLQHTYSNESEKEKLLSQKLTSFNEAGPEAVRETKKLLNFIENSSREKEIQEATTRWIAERRVSEEGQEGLRSFLEKGKPSWCQGSAHE